MIRSIYSNINLFVIALTVMFTIIGCKRSSPTNTNDIINGIFVQKIAFVNWEKNRTNPEISVTDLYNDSGTFKIHNTKQLVFGIVPSISYDKSWITYIDPTNGLTLKRINVDGTNDRSIQVPSGINVQSASISPDNSKLVINYGSFMNLSIGIMSSNGENFNEISVTNCSDCSGPVFSPDAKKIYFTYTDADNHFGHNVPPLAKSYVASINIDGTDLRFISDTANGFSDDFFSDISKDGKYITFVSLRNHPGDICPEIFVMDSSGSNIKQLTKEITSAKDNGHYDYYTMDDAAIWISDNEHVIFEHQYWQWNSGINDYTSTSDLYIINKDGTGMQKLTDNGLSSLLK